MSRFGSRQQAEGNAHENRQQDDGDRPGRPPPPSPKLFHPRRLEENELTSGVFRRNPRRLGLGLRQLFQAAEESHHLLGIDVERQLPGRKTRKLRLGDLVSEIESHLAVA